MKYSFMSFSCPELDLKSALRLAEDLGYDGFEPRIASNHKHKIEYDMSAEARKEARAIAADSRVKLCCLATSVQLANRRTLAAQMDDARRAIELCAELGIPSIRLFGGPIDMGDTRKAAIHQVAEALDTLSAEIGGEHISLCLETHDSWCEPKHVEAIMKLCRGKHVRVNWDIMHPVITAYADVDETFSDLRPYIGHVHMHGGRRIDNALKFLRVNDPLNVVDHRAAIKDLLSMDYQGYLSGEWIGWDEPDYLRTEIKDIRRIEEEVKCSK